MSNSDQKNLTPALNRSDCGASMVEFAVLVMLIALVVVAGVRSTGLELDGSFQQTQRALAGSGFQQENCQLGDPSYPACLGG